ncbi:MAG: zinc ABC transporter substrate-binding protein [Rhodobacteraceae bacterium]|nr:zinc ABC transporter substrate-binding protein [Paracoccaceae bacterium]MCF8515075.1 zinc ABC transporter substrate-binding protein [Paracoccaceae bacterium]MCF8519319.1 zinc ABC transporter substrate-binding protein [Paracoccaceae bacterium]
MRYIITTLLASAATCTMAFAEVPRVITDLPAIHSLTAQVMGDLGTPALVIDKGADAHSFQLRPSQAALLADGDLVVWMGPEMTPWLERALASLAQDTPQLALLAAPETYLRGFDATATDDHADHAAEDHAPHAQDAPAQDHDDHAQGADDTHDHGSIDPHAWLDPANARVWLGLIADQLATIDPDNAATYARNAALAQSGIDALDAELAAMLAPLKGRPFVASHDAYGYLIDHYGLSLVGTVAFGDASSPGAARLATLRDTVTRTNALCLFPEAQHDPAFLTQLAAETDTRIGGALDPAGTSLDPGPDAYGTLMRQLATTLADCLAP